MLTIKPNADQLARIRQAVQLAEQDRLALVMEESAKHEDLRNRIAKEHRIRRQGGEFISFQNTMVETLHMLISTEPKVKDPVVSFIRSKRQDWTEVHLRCPVEELLATRQNVQSV